MHLSINPAQGCTAALGVRAFWALSEICNARLLLSYRLALRWHPVLTIFTLVATGKVCRVVLRAVRGNLTRSSHPHSAAPEAVREAAQVQTASMPELSSADGRFDGADRIVAVRLDPPVGVLHLRVHNELSVVRRDLIISEGLLTARMGGHRHRLTEIDFDAVAGIEPIKAATVREVGQLFNTLGASAPAQIAIAV